jgi:mannan endo-1,4-beta-mannosidase
MNLSHLDSMSRDAGVRRAGCFLVLGTLLGCSAEGPGETHSLDTDGSTTAPSGITATGSPASTSGGMSDTASTSGSGFSSATNGNGMTSGGFGLGNATTTGASANTTGTNAGAGGSTSAGETSNSVGNTSGDTSGTGNPFGNTAGTTTGNSGGGGTGNTGCDAAGFYVEGTSVYDVNCNEFLMRGVNVPHAWYTSNTQGSFSDAASVGANTVRVVLATGGQWSRTSGSMVSQIISWAKENKLVAMLEVHDSTGFGESQAAVHPYDAVSYWTSSDVLGAITGQEAYVMINIANEPFGNTESTQWSSFHQEAVQALRSAGLKHLLVVDAPNWGQDWEETMRNNKNSAASNILDADPDRNVLFSVHMYDIYNTANMVTSYIDTFLGHGLPLVVGEFAADHGAGKNVDEATIMSKSAESRIGYIGWSWSGNSSDLGSLDITNNFNVSSLTAWGSTLINGASGIAETAQTCSCFE